ncbi:hypothetical protein T03_7431 [Trichinella britovi]|uniref:Uncharacterized protein n=1 Tax=Trichinella britovi TaxID=45882 RepID=A0A0V1DI84_TRIBR|nr:hypothetical protein T03_7431 [Trichinella britovi]
MPQSTLPLFSHRHKITTDCNDRRDSTETESDAPARYLSTFTIMNARSWLSRPEDFLVLQNIPN